VTKGHRACKTAGANYSKDSFQAPSPVRPNTRIEGQDVYH